MEPESWRWIWLAAAAALFIGEMSSPGSFFLLPFAIGAAVAAILGFMDVELWIQWAAFGGISLVTFLAFRPLARRLDESVDDSGVGVKRMLGASATTVDAVTGESGSIKFEGEEWRAVSEDGTTIGPRSAVTIVEIRGTRAVVRRAG
jgi:membrane protein implicated in regulation of membrane protease activity